MFTRSQELRNRRTVLLVAAFFCVALLSACVHQRALAGEAETPCQSAETQLELTACWTRAAEAAETVLQTRLDQANSSLKRAGQGQALAALNDAQRQWESYRDLHCLAAQERYRGGSVAATAGAVCRERLARTRSGEIESVFLDEGSG